MDYNKRESLALPLASHISNIISHSASPNSRSASSFSESTPLYADDEEAGLLNEQKIEQEIEKIEITAKRTQNYTTTRSNLHLIAWTTINTLATIAIVFTNKAIFADPRLRLNQSTFAAFHFTVTGLTLWAASRPSMGMFGPVRKRIPEMMPLALAMCANVILPNLSLAFSSVAFYQIVRVLLTPLVAIINLIFYGTKIPRKAVYCLIPICLGVAIVSFYDTMPAKGGRSKKVASINATTSWIGVFFAFSGVLASSLYTVWIGTYHKKFNMNSMQLLFNQAPLGAFLLLFVIPFTDSPPNWSLVPESRWILILLSGVMAALINISQFFIVAGSGAVSSTVVGHLKTCLIVALGWISSGRKASDRGILGILMAIAGIIAYSFIMYHHKKQAPESQNQAQPQAKA